MGIHMLGAFVCRQMDGTAAMKFSFKTNLEFGPKFSDLYIKVKVFHLRLVDYF